MTKFLNGALRFSILMFLFNYSFTLGAQDKKLSQEEIIEKYLKNGAWKYPYFTHEWQQKIDEGLKLDSTIAYLWQQKAMPLYKQMKYQAGVKYLDKAVKFDADKWLGYRGFMNCIFTKDYRAAIRDFEQCKKSFPGRYVMDHSYDFYIAISLLQLNEFKKAEDLLVNEIRKEKEQFGADGNHYMTFFYLGIVKLELQKWEEAIAEFDKAIKIYSHFSDAKYYKGIALGRLSRGEEVAKLWKEAKADFEAGYTINEDNAIYEKYPYQMYLWKFVH